MASEGEQYEFKATQKITWDRSKIMATHYGEHLGITCDGCGDMGYIGFRFRCTKCKNREGTYNHDFCEKCFETFQKGTLNWVTQGSNELSDEIKDHHFEPFAGGKGQFASLGGSQSAAPVKKKKKTKPNEPCPCGSGKKYKKCCGKGGGK